MDKFLKDFFVLEKIVVWAVSLLHVLIVYGQGGVYDAYAQIPPNVTYPDPTSTNLQKFLGYPVSPATGLVDITIPLYDLQIRNLTVPFQLKYHSGGIKQQDMPGLPGYGWTMFPGCKITRTIMGKPDDIYPTKYARNYFENPTYEQLINTATPASPRDMQGNYGPGENDRNDGQYDIFSIHLPAIDATFILQYNDTTSGYDVMTIPECPLRIVPHMDHSSALLKLYRFEVIDDKGIRYYFGEPRPVPQINRDGFQFVEQTNDNEFYSCITSWMLEKIVLPNTKDSVLFSYEKYLEQSRFCSYSDVIIDKGECLSYDSYMISPSEAVEFIAGEGGHSESVSDGQAHFYHSLRPTKIWTNDLQMFFTYGTYQDGVSYLSTIKVYSLTNPDIPLKSILFKTRYPGFLDQVFVSGLGTYHFDYEEFDGEFSSYVENYMLSSNAIDWWGYFNGKMENKNNLPKLEITKISSYVPGNTSNTSVGNADRTPNERYMKLKSLKKITYPTGGTFQAGWTFIRIKSLQ